MNKISKKIVALVTMAAFVLTLAPVAAFAAPGTVEGSTATVTQVAWNKAKVDVEVSDTDLQDIASGNVVVWVTDASGAEVQPNAGVTSTNTAWSVWAAGTAGKNAFFTQGAKTLTTTLTFAKEGTYTIHVALNEGSANSVSDLTQSLVEETFTTREAVSEQSKYGVIENGAVQAEDTVEVDTNLETTFYINAKDSAATDDKLAKVYVWAVNEKGEVTGLSAVSAGTGASLKVGQAQSVGNGTDRYAFPLTNVSNGDKLNVQFNAPGTYTLYAGVGNTYDIAKNATLNKDDVNTKVTVTDDSEITDLKLTATVDNQLQDLDFDKDTNTYTLDLTGTDFAFDGNDKIVINGTAYIDGKIATGKTINFETTAPKSVVEFWSTDNSTGNDGKFGTTITMQDKQNALISITDSEGNVDYTLRIIAQKTTATNIDRTLTGGYVLAGTDKDYADAVYNGKTVNFDNAVEFEITDQKGNPVTDENVGAIIDIKGQPKKSDLTSADLSLVSLGNGKYTLAYKNGGDYAADLVEGEYTVRVSLPSEDNATVTFNVAEFGNIEDVQLELAVGNHKLDNEVLLDDTVDVSLVYVDGNGIEVPAPNNFNWSVKSPAHAVVTPNYANHQFTLKADTIEHQGVIGSEVTVQAAVEDYGLVEKTLTIVDSYNTYSLEFDPTEGPVNEYNKVDVTVLEDDGDEARVGGTVNAVLVDSSNADAKASVTVNKSNQLVVYSDQETELEIVVVVTNGNEIVAAGTLNYTVGAADPLANRSVVMTIGSTEYVVNNQIITGDAAPFVDSNWRTMVPIRALAEAFDAEVNWDNDARTVTINYDANTQIVMTIGEETYTVNGADQTMDTEPVIQGDRTYVPIRFAAEALGFTVTPLYNSNGLTGSVVFQR